MFNCTKKGSHSHSGYYKKSFLIIYLEIIFAEQTLSLHGFQVSNNIVTFSFGVDPNLWFGLSNSTSGWTAFNYSIEDTLTKADIWLVKSTECPKYDLANTLRWHTIY